LTDSPSIETQHGHPGIVLATLSLANVMALLERHEHIKVATVGNPGLHLATMAGGLPGVSSVMTHYLERKMEKLDIPSIPEFIEMISDTGAGLYGCKASCDLFELTKDDLIEQVKDIITVGEFYEMAAGGHIIFT